MERRWGWPLLVAVCLPLTILALYVAAALWLLPVVLLGLVLSVPVVLALIVRKRERDYVARRR